MQRDIAKFLKTKRKEAGLTQEQFALKAGVSIGYLRKIEQGQPIETFELLNQMLSMFNAKLGVVNQAELNDNER
ncbi:MAG: helix-turn-helix transcriptional regulator [Cyclobacteriaceae bacterium]|nr:helix-turn-helix transcriptional regulator [Cyclobacteriaceae bacterium]